MKKTKDDSKKKKRKRRIKPMKDYQYHFGCVVRIYPSDKQKKMIKENYDAQRFVYNENVATDREIYRLKRTTKACYIARSPIGRITYRNATCSYADINRMQEIEKLQACVATATCVKKRYFFLQNKDIDSLSLANANQNHNKAWKNYRELSHGTPRFHKKSSA